MAVAEEWDEVEEAFDRLEGHSALQMTLAAMRKLAHMVRHDAAFANVHPRVSMVSIFFAREQAERRVYVTWHEDGGYKVAFVDPPLEFSERTMVREDAVVRVLREYLDRLGAT